ncbi:MAG: hypothetical protein DSY89_03490, partial [Deltaproteobacteria bacterium]
MSPLIVDKKEKYNRIVQVALIVFSRQGYAAASMQQIGEAAGVGKSTLYEYFESKADVFIAAIQAWIDQITCRMTALMEDKIDPIEKMRAAVELVNEIGRQGDNALNRLYIEVYEQMIVETGVLYKRGDLVHEMSAGIRRILTDVILHGISTGVFKAEIARDAERIAANVTACIDGLLLHNLLGNHLFDLKWQVDYYLNTFIETIRVPIPRHHLAA